MSSQHLSHGPDCVTRKGTPAHLRRRVTTARTSLPDLVRHVCAWAAARRALSPWRVAVVVGLGVCTGCAAAYTPPPLTTQHPAHPEAAPAPTLPPSATLAYGPSDM